MNIADAIKDKGKLQEVLSVYETGSKNHLLLVYALYTGLRISDILSTKVADVKGGFLTIKEQKTGKQRTVKINSKLLALLKAYTEENQLDDDDYIFFSNHDTKEHIKRSRADKIIRYAGDMVGVRLSAHSLRKTFGYMAYQNGTDISLLMQIFNHSSAHVTLRYIGITQDNINDVYDSIEIF